jgi:alpha-tubulin suppressor-like RCC1 family protein
MFAICVSEQYTICVRVSLFKSINIGMQCRQANVISCGGEHMAAVTQDGRVVCWGSNNYGMSTPPDHLEGQIVVAVSCGTTHTAALTSEGRVVCWGANFCGCSTVPPTVQDGGAPLWVQFHCRFNRRGTSDMLGK